MQSTVTTAGAKPHLWSCPDCGYLQRVPAMQANHQANCPRCALTLRRMRPNWYGNVLALTLTSLSIYIIAVSSPFLSVDIVGQQRDTTLISLPYAFWEHGTPLLAVAVLCTAILAPLAKICVLLYVLIGLRVEQPPAYIPAVFKWYRRLGPWAMVEVFLLGVMVAFTRLGAIAKVHTGLALYAMAALMITMVLADYLLDPEATWERMEARGLVPGPTVVRGEPIGCRECERANSETRMTCTRCEGELQPRKPHSVSTTWALLAAGMLLYLPANLFPVLTLTRIGRTASSTILGGAEELLEGGLWPLALLVFVASILVPLLKLAGLTWMLLSIQFQWQWAVKSRTRLFRVVAFIGRWSMIDVFMMSTLVGLVQAGAVANIQPEIGAVCFCAVVILTMIAVECFDPRLMWDAAGYDAHGLQPAPRRPESAAQAETA